MISDEDLLACIARAALAPSIHNTQPARWLRDGAVLSLCCDTDVGLRVADPTGYGAALSCGAALEAMVLSLSAIGLGADIELTDHVCTPLRGRVALAHLTLREGTEDRLHRHLEARFTWRGGFAEGQPDLFGWSCRDTRLVVDAQSRAWLAERNDAASYDILQDAAFRAELLRWMRLSPRHPRAGLDGMDRAALRMTAAQARALPLGMGRLWGVLRALGQARGLTAETEMTLTAPVIVLFFRDKNENPLQSGRAYLRLCLEAVSLGLAGWPMAALSDHPEICAETCAAFGITADQRLVQAIRFGKPTGAPPPRARRPLAELLR